MGGSPWTKAVAFAAVAVGILIVSLHNWRGLLRDTLASTPVPADPETAFAELRSGNARFVRSARTLSTDTGHDAENRLRVAKGQHPFAVILCCSDSRVCPEFIFDQRAGSIFEIRNAGNVVDEDVLASADYAVEHLHVPLVLVMGHKSCGAVAAVCAAGDTLLPDHFRELQKHMNAIRERIHASHEQHDATLLDRLSLENARQQARALMAESQVIRTAVTKGEVRLVCGLYDMETGPVEFFDP